MPKPLVQQGPRRLNRRSVLLFLSVVLVVTMGSVVGTQAFAADAIPRAAEGYRGILLREARQVWGLDAPTASFAAQIQQESGWRNGLISRTGAQGLTQFMPATARWIGGMDHDLAQVAPTNPTWAIRALVVYDRWLWQRVSGDDGCERMAFALSSYNGGLGWVNKRKAMASRIGLSPGICFDQTCSINPGIASANQAENEQYPRRILLRYESLYRSQSIRWGNGACS